MHYNIWNYPTENKIVHISPTSTSTLKCCLHIHLPFIFWVTHLSLLESAGAVGFPSSVQCGRCEDLCEQPTGGDRAFGATYELSAGSFHWAHKSFPVEKGTQRKCQLLCRSVVTSKKMACLNNGHVHILQLYSCHCNSCMGLSYNSLRWSLFLIRNV